MKSWVLGCVVSCFVLVFAGCGVVESENSQPVADLGPTMMNQLPLEDCSEFGCPNGCVQIDYGVDENANGSLDTSEVDGTEYICHGSDGEQGDQGPAGADGTAGEDGADGSSGTNSLINISDSTPSMRCPVGGKRIDVGLDTNSNGTLDTDEVTASTELCDPCVSDPSCGANACFHNEMCIPKGMVYVPAGSFSMGCSNDSGSAGYDEECDNVDYGEGTYHEVTLGAFFIDQTEVTAKAFKACVDAKLNGDPHGCDYTGSTQLSHRTFGNPGFENFPIVYVNWSEADTYCRWKGRHLPTEAQWEKAARGTDGRKYPWGEATVSPEYAVVYGSSLMPDKQAVGGLDAGKSPYGAYDMIGNVSEWTHDWYSQTYYSESPASNPTGPAAGERKVHRGGNFYYSGTDGQRAAARGNANPAYQGDEDDVAPPGRGDYIGFRCAQTVDPCEVDNGGCGDNACITGPFGNKACYVAGAPCIVEGSSGVQIPLRYGVTCFPNSAGSYSDTGLTWETPSGYVDCDDADSPFRRLWSQSQAACTDLNAQEHAGQSDGWRLPTIHELYSYHHAGAVPLDTHCDYWSNEVNLVTSYDTTTQTFTFGKTFRDVSSWFSDDVSENKLVSICVRTPPAADDYTILSHRRFTSEASASSASDAIVRDKLTGKRWYSGITHGLTEPSAERHCTNLSTDGHESWELASISDLMSLFDSQGKDQVTQFPPLVAELATLGSDGHTLKLWSNSPNSNAGSHQVDTFRPETGQVFYRHKLGTCEVPAAGNLFNNFRCGSDAQACDPPFERCWNGECVSLSSGATFEPESIPCDEPKERCLVPTPPYLDTYYCVDVQADDPYNCGGCGTVCEAGQTCTDGACTCAQHQTLCTDSCVNLDTDPQNCGSCGNGCADGKKCQDGACQDACASDFEDCSNSCIQVKTTQDRDHCGACNHACADYQVCREGHCVDDCRDFPPGAQWSPAAGSALCVMKVEGEGAHDGTE